MNSWKTVSSKLALNNKWFKVRQDSIRLPNGRVIDDYYLWLNNDVALVLAITPENQFVLTQQYKHGAGKTVTEFPAGYLNQGEKPEEAARRELAEETGYHASNLVFLAKLTNDATKEIATISIFLAKNAQKSQAVSFDENEEIETVLRTPKQVMDMITNGEIWVSASVAAAFLAFQRLRLLPM